MPSRATAPARRCADLLVPPHTWYIDPRIQAGCFVMISNVTAKIDLSRESPFLTIWTRPRATIRGIIEQNPNYGVLPIAIAGGIIQRFNSSTS